MPLRELLTTVPIYITDKPGKQNFEILNKLCYSDGRLIRPDESLTPTEDCLFQLQDPGPFKAFSRDGKAGLLGVWNMADTTSVKGQVSVNDVYGLEGESFIAYEYFSKRLQVVNSSTPIDIELGRMGIKLFFFIPAQGEVAAIGLLDKYNAPGTIIEEKTKDNTMEVLVADHGQFGAVLPQSHQYSASGW